MEYRRGADIKAEVHVDDRTGAVAESWEGTKAEWRGARGSRALVDEGETGRLTNSTWVWVGLSLLFVLPFLDPRRPFRALHLDLALLLSLAVSHVALNHGRVGLSVALAFPVLGALAVRYAVLALRRREAAREDLIPFAPVWLVAAGAVALLGARAVANIGDSVATDVAFAGVAGADRIQHGLDLYARGGQAYDTYGPVNYLLYWPFERLLPLRGQVDPDLWAAHATSITLDALVAVLLFVLGRRLRAGRGGTVLGVALAYAWAAFPYSWYALAWNTNDAMVPLFLLAAVLAAGRPALAGALLGAGVLTKFSPAVAAGVLGRRVYERAGLRAAAGFVAAAAVVTGATVALYLPDGGLREVYDTTVGFQLGRTSPFTPWGYGGAAMDALHVLVKVALPVMALASLFAGPRLDAVRMCAWIAALMLTLQLGLGYWAETYVVWYAPFAFVALFSIYRTVRER